MIRWVESNGVLTFYDEETLTLGQLGLDDTPVWRIHKNHKGKIRPVLCAWYTEDYPEESFLTDRTFGTKKDAEDWLEEFWEAFWRLC